MSNAFPIFPTHPGTKPSVRSGDGQEKGQIGEFEPRGKIEDWKRKIN